MGEKLPPEVRSIVFDIGYYLSKILSYLLSSRFWEVKDEIDKIELAEQVDTYMSELKASILKLEKAISKLNDPTIKGSVSVIKNIVFSISPRDYESLRSHAFKLSYVAHTTFSLLVY